jgi:hypothetical protein
VYFSVFRWCLAPAAHHNIYRLIVTGKLSHFCERFQRSNSFSPIFNILQSYIDMWDKEYEGRVNIRQ